MSKVGDLGALILAGNILFLPLALLIEEQVTYPVGDSRRLPPRIDTTQPDYLGLITPMGIREQAGSYTVAEMDTAVEQAVANPGAMGSYCNALMVEKALFDRLPENPPAPLEQIIDSAVKTGDDLSRVVAWNQEHSRQILAEGVLIPNLLQPRLVALGAKLNQLYVTALRQGKRNETRSPLSFARQAVADYLSHFPPPQQEAVLLAALSNVYRKEGLKSDTAVWLAAEKGTGEPAIASRTIAALRSLKVLDEMIETKEGLIRYPAGWGADGE